MCRKLKLQDATSIKEVVATREDDVLGLAPPFTKGPFNVHANPKMSRRSIDYGTPNHKKINKGNKTKKSRIDPPIFLILTRYCLLIQKPISFDGVVLFVCGLGIMKNGTAILKVL